MRPLYVSRAGGTKLLNAIFMAVPIVLLLFDVLITWVMKILTGLPL